MSSRRRSSARTWAALHREARHDWSDDSRAGPTREHRALCLPGDSFPVRDVICWRSIVVDGRYDYRYERPHYAWADTVVRPVCLRPMRRCFATSLGPEWTDEGLAGMTGIVRTSRTVSERPEDVMPRLMQMDEGAGGS